MPGVNDSSNGPASSVVAVTPHDTNPISPARPRALWVGTAGNVTLRGIDDTTDAVIKNVPAGTMLALRASHVRATGTTAADIVALY